LEIIELLDKLGTGLYIFTEIQKHREIAIEALFEADPNSPAKELLTEKIEELGKI
jgi:geranylgeranyl pyrophosphate synthase